MVDIVKQLQSHRLTTAEIVYHMPDHYQLLQSYIWQELDLVPDFPVLHNFLDFWEHNLDGKLHSVVVVNVELVTSAELAYYNKEFYLN